VKHWPIGAIVLASAMWVSALFLPVWETRSDQTGLWDTVPGYVPALVGFLGVLVLCPAWYANLLIPPLMAIVLKARPLGFVLSILAFLVAATAYGMLDIYGGNDVAVIVGRRIGYYLWLGSFLVLMLSHAPPGERYHKLQWAFVLLLLLSVGALESLLPVGVSPAEEALRDPNDTATLAQVLAQNPPQAEKDEALWWALIQDRSDASGRAAMLIDGGANVNHVIPDGTSPLILALRGKQNESIVSLLLKAGANVNQMVRYGTPPLVVALQYRASDAVVTQLMQAGADVHYRNQEGATPLIIALEWRASDSVIEQIVRAGAEDKVKYRNVTSAVDYARSLKHSQAVIDLLQESAEKSK
jgi:hypothetical protein